ncbi:MAG: tyrosine-type recombinase/integrase [Lachnospiraceae bacterium]
MSNISMSDAELLKFAIENGMLDTALVQGKIEMQKREEILEKHPYAIWQGKDEYWRTYLPYGNERKMIKKKEKAGIENAVIDYWGEKVLNSFKDRFWIWVERQEKCGRSDNTISKYESDYKRFFEGDKIENISVQDMSDEEISEFIQRLLNRKEIPYRALKAMFMNGIFEKARIDKIIETNPCQYIDLPIFKQYCIEKKPKTAKERTVSNEEKKKLIDKLNVNYKRNQSNIARYAVELSLYTGMRVGELSGLKWEDINYEECTITICRSEKYNRKKNEFYISSTKNDKVRIFPLTKEIKDVLIKVKRAEISNGFLSEYVFSDENGRVHARRISECARNMTMTKEFGNTKSIHAIRRTFNSNLRCNGVSATVAAALLGHTEKVNEENYTYDVSSISEKMKIVEEAGKIS